MLMLIRYWVRKVIHDALKTKAADGKQSIEEQLESAEKGIGAAFGTVN